MVMSLSLYSSLPSGTRTVFTSSPHADRISAWLLVIVLVGFYGIFLYSNVVNIPRLDDYNALLSFIVEYRDADTWAERFKLLTTKHNEHLLLLNRLIALTQYSLIGEINVRQLVFVGNSFMLITFLLYVSQLPASENRPFQLTLGALILFQPLAWHSGTWAMAALSNFGVWPLGLSALIAANHSRLRIGRICAAFLLGLAACFTLGNGFVVFLLLPLVIYLQSRDRRALILAALWLIIAVLLYQFLLSNQVPHVEARTEHSLRFVLVAPLRALLYHLVLTGYFFTDQVIIAAALGLIGAGYTALCLVDLYKGKATNTGLFIVFIMGSLAVITLFRAGLSFGILDINHRFWFYSQLFWFSVILDAISRLEQHERWSLPAWSKTAVMLLFTCLLLSRHVTAAQELRLLNRDLVRGQEAWLVNKHSLSNRHLFLASVAAPVLQQGIEAQIYRPFENHTQYVEPELSEECDKGRQKSVDGHFRLEAGPDAFLHRLTGWAQIPHKNGLPKVILLCTQQGGFVLPWRWTEEYLGPDSVDWTVGNIFNIYYLFQPLPTDIETVVFVTSIGRRFSIKTKEPAPAD